jgi:hypothetical protein
MSFLKSLKNIFIDDNKINESNIILFILTFMLVVIDIVALIKTPNIYFIMLVGEHLLAIFLFAKSEHSKLDANKVVEVACEALKK